MILVAKIDDFGIEPQELVKKVDSVFLIRVLLSLNKKAIEQLKIDYLLEIGEELLDSK